MMAKKSVLPGDLDLDDVIAAPGAAARPAFLHEQAEAAPAPLPTGVVHFSADFGLHGRVKPPACEGRILVGGPPVRKVVSLCVSLARLGSLWLKRSQTQQGEPVRMALPSHYFARAFALALRASTADEAVMVQVKLQ